jgi:hypothetical protein
MKRYKMRVNIFKKCIKMRVNISKNRIKMRVNPPNPRRGHYPLLGFFVNKFALIVPQHFKGNIYLGLNAPSGG